MRKRKNVDRKFIPTFAVVVDGETEVCYLQMLKRHEGKNRNANVRIDPQIPQKTSLEDQNRKVLTLAKDYTFVYWVVDLDKIIEEAREAKKGIKTRMAEFLYYRTYIEEKKIDNVIILVNNPCLEYWFLLHYKNTRKKFSNCSSAIIELKKHLQDYDKNKKYFTKQDNDIYMRLKPHQDTAIKNAQATGKFSVDKPDATICEMHELVVRLKELLN